MYDKVHFIYSIPIYLFFICRTKLLLAFYGQSHGYRHSVFFKILLCFIDIYVLYLNLKGLWFIKNNFWKRNSYWNYNQWVTAGYLGKKLYAFASERLYKGFDLHKWNYFNIFPISQNFYFKKKLTDKGIAHLLNFLRLDPV